ncbi:MAG: Stp1/IreP family PP2C-type Ser/Thr phosphatase [Ruminococcaceae bacterium]|nr:Stp1/IreP family PP2C-type Ser/Thr phosphatase [Oscillospiraceae bacterium]
MILNGKTDIGLRRKNNQDSFVIRLWNDIGCALGVVCDGMGGANGGNIASALACEHFVSAVEAFMHTDRVRERTATEGDYSSMLARAVTGANQCVYSSTEKDKSLKGMGTTLVAALVVGDVLYAVNVGDSRLYLYNRGRLTQITRDHSLVQYLMDTGKLTREEARDYPNRNVITRAVGIERSIESDIFSVDLSRLSEDACALLCSDGLSGYVEAEEIQSLMAAGLSAQPYDGDATAAALVNAANETGGADNITVVLMRLKQTQINESKDD